MSVKDWPFLSINVRKVHVQNRRRSHIFFTGSKDYYQGTISNSWHEENKYTKLLIVSMFNTFKFLKAIFNHCPFGFCRGNYRSDRLRSVWALRFGNNHIRPLFYGRPLRLGRSRSSTTLTTQTAAS